MPRRINMKRLIKAHQVDYELVTVDEAQGDYDDAGEWTKPEEVREARQAVILPLGEKNVYELGGRYTTQDIRVLSLTKIPLKAKIVKGHMTYSVEEETDYLNYSDFYVYLCKAVSRID